MSTVYRLRVRLCLLSLKSPSSLAPFGQNAPEKEYVWTSCKSAGRRGADCLRVQRRPGSLWVTTGATHLAILHRRPLYRHSPGSPQRKQRPRGTGEGAHRRYTFREGAGSQGWRGRPSRLKVSLMGQKMCPRGELGLRPQTSIKYLFSPATWRRQGRERGWRDAATVASTLISLICPTT